MPSSRQDPAPIRPRTTSAPAPAVVQQPLMERPGHRPAGPRRFLRDVDLPYLSNGAIGLVFTASGAIVVTLAVGAAGGLTRDQLASWVFGILFSGGAATLIKSLLYRQPLGFAWSIPGTVLLGPSLQHLSFPEVVGTFFTAGLLILALGATGMIRPIMTTIPMPIVMAMLPPSSSAWARTSFPQARPIRPSPPRWWPSSSSCRPASTLLRTDLLSQWHSSSLR